METNTPDHDATSAASLERILPQIDAYAARQPQAWLKDLGVIVATYLLAMGIFFRTIIWSEFDLGFGDRADGIIEIAILEHWRNVLSGAASWNATFYFHPYADTLGYNDGYLLHGVSYSFWRLFTDAFHADTLNALTFRTIGFVASYALVARTLRWGGGAAALVAFLWTIASAAYLQAGHAQLGSVALLPVAMILSIGICRAEVSGSLLRARVLAITLAALMAAWLLTAYYMAWFTIFSGCLFVGILTVLTGDLRPASALRFIRRHLATLCCGGAAFAILAIPFLVVYLPKMHETGGEAYQEMLGYLVTPVVDMINVGPGNLVWGWIFRSLMALVHVLAPADPGLPERVIGGEHETGLPPVFFAIVIAAGWRIIVHKRGNEGSPASATLRAFAMTTGLAWILTLQLWIASPWGLVFWLVPGAKGLRVVSRYQLWLGLPFLLIAAAVWRGSAMSMVRSKPAIAAAIVCLLAIENLSTESPAHLRRSVQLSALELIPAPPPYCRSFYVVASRVDEVFDHKRVTDGVYPHNVDAMLLSELWRVPTVNGFSTFNPPDWKFADPRAAAYDADAVAYARRHHLRDLCRLDMREPTVWSVVPNRLLDAQL